jgi:hypothetical protein
LARRLRFAADIDQRPAAIEVARPQRLVPDVEILTLVGDALAADQARYDASCGGLRHPSRPFLGKGGQQIFLSNNPIVR